MIKKSYYEPLLISTYDENSPWGAGIGDEIAFIEEVIEENNLSDLEKDKLELAKHHLEEYQNLIKLLLKTAEFVEDD